MPSFLICLHPVARNAALLLVLIAILLGFGSVLLHRRVPWIAVIACGVLMTLALWFGSYRISPLGFGAGRIPLLSGFRITQALRGRMEIAPRQIITVAPGSATGIEPRLLPGPVSCLWIAANGGAFDDPASCDTAYAPAQGASFDTLRVNLRSACGLPPVVGELRVSVLP